MELNATFNNISAISWRSVLLVEETGGPGENPDLSQVTDKLYHIMLYTSPWSRFELTTSVVIGTDCISSCKSNYHMIMATMAPIFRLIVKVFYLTMSHWTIERRIELSCLMPLSTIFQLHVYRGGLNNRTISDSSTKLCIP